MTAGFGMSIGTVNSVWAATTGDRDRPAVRVRRTAVTFDRGGDVRVGGVPRFAPVITDFADLTQSREPVVLGGRIWSSADLVAAVATCLIDASDPVAGPVLTYPACYTERQIAALQYALHRTGAFDVVLMPEPVAAVEWLDDEYGVSPRGLTLVYDLGANSLDVAVVRTEAQWEQRGVLGSAVRSDAYGGRPLGTVLARYARALAPDVPAPVSKVVPVEDTRRLRTWHVRNSLRVVRRCLGRAAVSIDDVDRILLVGGAARPVEVAEVLAELGPPVVVSPDPGHTVATGAAIASARFARSGGNFGRYARGAAVVSSAAVVSALAMSAATMIGGGPVGTDGPIMEFAPALAGPADSVREQAGELTQLPSFGAGFAALAVRADRLMGSSLPTLRGYAGAAHNFSDRLSERVENALLDRRAVLPCEPPKARTYSDPARFTNPMPFGNPGTAALLAAGAATHTPPGGSDPGTPPDGSHAPGNPPAAGNPGSSTGATQGSANTPTPGTAPAPAGTPASGDASPVGTSAPDTSSGPGAGTPAESTGANSSGTVGDSGTSAAESGTAHSGETASQGRPADTGNAGDAATPGSPTNSDDANSSTSPHASAPTDSGDAANSGGTTNSGESATSSGTGAGTADSSAGAAHSAPGASSADSAPNPVPAPGASQPAGTGGTASTPGSTLGTGGTNTAPAVPARPGGMSPSPGVTPRPGGLGTGTTPGGGFHGGGLGSGMGGGFHGGGFGGFGGGFGH